MRPDRLWLGSALAEVGDHLVTHEPPELPQEAKSLTSLARVSLSFVPARCRRPVKTVGGRGISRVMIRLPSLRRELHLRYPSDAELRALCEHYEDAHQALDIRQRSLARMTVEISEYVQLLGNLEAHIRERVQPKGEPQRTCKRPRTWATAARRLLRRVRRLAVEDIGRSDSPE
jgi:hypothetical protein